MRDSLRLINTPQLPSVPVQGHSPTHHAGESTALGILEHAADVAAEVAEHSGRSGIVGSGMSMLGSVAGWGLHVYRAPPTRGGRTARADRRMSRRDFPAIYEAIERAAGMAHAELFTVLETIRVRAVVVTEVLDEGACRRLGRRARVATFVDAPGHYGAGITPRELREAPLLETPRGDAVRALPAPFRPWATRVLDEWRAASGGAVHITATWYDDRVAVCAFGDAPYLVLVPLGAQGRARGDRGGASGEVIGWVSRRDLLPCAPPTVDLGCGSVLEPTAVSTRAPRLTTSDSEVTHAPVPKKRLPVHAAPEGSLGQRIATGLHKIGLAMKQETWRQANERGLSATQGQILAALTSAGALTGSELSGKLGVGLPTISDSARVLVEKGLVARAPDPRHPRATLLSATREGRAIGRRARAWPEIFADAVDAMSVAEQEGFFAGLVKMIHELQEQGLVPVSGMCVTCTHFRPHTHAAGPPHHCALIDAPIGAVDVRLDCPDHELADEPVRRERWARFTATPA